ncbi:MAG: hypothetical protein IPI06_09000 [Gammaproteobacteria bacterium]|nr:hypothetical protein [Gammaproteobacteria bacterium]
MPLSIQPKPGEDRTNQRDQRHTVPILRARSSKRTKICGNPRCHCARDPAARHGPYYEWSYLKGGRLHHRTLTPKQAELMRLAIHSYRKAKKLLRTWEAHTSSSSKFNAPE